MRVSQSHLFCVLYATCQHTCQHFYKDNLIWLWTVLIGRKDLWLMNIESLCVLGTTLALIKVWLGVPHVSRA